jgi:hypothetical protein
MPRGGSRPGAGRKPGSALTKTATIAAKLTEDGLTPLEVLLAVMRDETQPQNVRLQCAIAAAPYVHPRLAHVQQTIHRPDILGKLLAQIKADDAANMIEHAPALISNAP